MTEEDTAPIQPEAAATPTEPQEDWKDKYFRTLAEMENMRKRMQKERQDITRFGIENAIGDFLPAIDSFENALQFANGAAPEVKNWALGFQMILTQFKDILVNQGITTFDSVGALFNPDLHEAVEAVETMDYPEGQILQEFTKGYRSATRTLRPARVKVAKRPNTKDNLNN